MKHCISPQANLDCFCTQKKLQFSYFQGPPGQFKGWGDTGFRLLLAYDRSPVQWYPCCRSWFETHHGASYLTRIERMLKNINA